MKPFVLSEKRGEIWKPDYSFVTLRTSNKATPLQSYNLNARHCHSLYSGKAALTINRTLFYNGSSLGVTNVDFHVPSKFAEGTHDYQLVWDAETRSFVLHERNFGPIPDSARKIEDLRRMKGAKPLMELLVKTGHLQAT